MTIWLSNKLRGIYNNRQCINGVFFILDVIIKEVNVASMKYEVVPFKAERNMRLFLLTQSEQQIRGEPERKTSII